MEEQPVRNTTMRTRLTQFALPGVVFVGVCAIAFLCLASKPEADPPAPARTPNSIPIAIPDRVESQLLFANLPKSVRQYLLEQSYESDVQLTRLLEMIRAARAEAKADKDSKGVVIGLVQWSDPYNGGRSVKSEVTQFCGNYFVYVMPRTKKQLTFVSKAKGRKPAVCRLDKLSWDEDMAIVNDITGLDPGGT